ncbi:hypothetical protein DFH29DRAFT_1004371 [Suillus ampliporus]|nr:hypothetical protein DFH29DRAFT_1004371 [Suillus ampliporus]
MSTGPDLGSYEADTSISVSDVNSCSDVPLTNLSDDIFFNLFFPLAPKQAICDTCPTKDPGSTTEPESDELTTPLAPTSVIAPKYDPGSTTEPESDEPTPLAPTSVVAPKYNPGSTTEPESDKPMAPVTTMTLTASSLKRKSFFATPSPPGPNSIYWKYVSQEEDAVWYDRSGTDDRFRVARQLKRELQQLCDQ